MYNIKIDYINKLRAFLLGSAELNLTEDAQTYVDNYDPAVLQGFLVWNYSAYIAKEYEFDDVRRTDYFIIPLFGGLENEGTCSGIQYFGINIDVHRDIDQTGRRSDLIAKEIRDWHRELLIFGISPVQLDTRETYMILPNGVTPRSALQSQPYYRSTIKYKLDYLSKP